MRTLRNVFRRKLRVLLTIFGITIGVLALVVMGSMAEKINLLVSGGTKYYSDKVTVQAEGTACSQSAPSLYSNRDAHQERARGGRRVRGHRDAARRRAGCRFGMPAMITGSDMAGQESRELQDDLRCRDGPSPLPTSARWWWEPTWWTSSAQRWEARHDTGRAVHGGGHPGQDPHRPRHLGLSGASRRPAPLDADLPEVIRGQVDQSDLVTSFVVYPTPGTDPEELAAAINESVPGVIATGPQAFQDQVASAMGIFNAILYGIAIIALFVGGLSVINTMTMSVNERTREIGVRKAIGASDGQIVGQFLAESGVIGLIGGVSGLFLGWVAATVTDMLLEPRNLDLFLVTPRLAIGSVAFAVLLGLVSGLYPSLHAARLQPVLALRYE